MGISLFPASVASVLVSLQPVLNDLGVDLVRRREVRVEFGLIDLDMYTPLSSYYNLSQALHTN